MQYGSIESHYFSQTALTCVYWEHSFCIFFFKKNKTYISPNWKVLLSETLYYLRFSERGLEVILFAGFHRNITAAIYYYFIWLQNVEIQWRWHLTSFLPSTVGLSGDYSTRFTNQNCLLFHFLANPWLIIWPWKVNFPPRTSVQLEN